MLEQQIREMVEQHYRGSNPRLLLLSSLGKMLSDRKLWPEAGENRTLLDVVGNVRGVSIVRDETSEAFIAVVREGEENLAEKEIVRRHKLFFLRGLPRALLLAFTIPVDEPAKMFVRLSPKLQYKIDTAGGEGEIFVDPDLRVPRGVPIELDELSAEEIEHLEVGVRSWADRNELDLTSLKKNHHSTPKNSRRLTPSEEGKNLSALERLFAAQESEVAKRMVIPLDIAILLGKH